MKGVLKFFIGCLGTICLRATVEISQKVLYGLLAGSAIAGGVVAGAKLYIDDKNNQIEYGKRGRDDAKKEFDFQFKKNVEKIKEMQDVCDQL